MESYEIIWERVLRELETTVSTISYSTFIMQLKPIDIIKDKIILSTQNAMFAKEVAERLVDKIRLALKSADTGLRDIEIWVGNSREDYLKQYGVQYEAEEIESIPIDPKYTFETFVVGSSNKVLYAASMAVAENPGMSYSPLFIYGGTGLGKTHIMHAIANQIRSNNPAMNIMYATCEKFSSDLISNIRQGKAYTKEGESFRNKYRSVDVLIIDDVQFLAKKISTQEEFFHTFNELYSQNKQIILSADCDPSDIELLSDRLKTRFEGGLKVEVLPPDIETKVAILQKKAEAKKHKLELDVAYFLAERSSNDVRSLEGLLNKVLFAALLHEDRVTVGLAREALNESAQEDNALTTTTDEIIEQVCKYYKITKQDLVGKRKTKEIVEPRQVCCYLMTELISIPLQAVGQILGGRDHTTIMHARDKIAEHIQINQKLSNDVSDIKNLILKK